MKCMVKDIFALAAFCLAVCCAAAEEIGLSFKPYISNITENSATIVWTTTEPSVGWVEFAPDDGSSFYACTRPKVWDSSIGIKNIDTVHSATIRGLVSGVKYRYRVYAQEVLKTGPAAEVYYGRTVADDVYNKKASVFTTTNPAKPSVVFSVVNDIHSDNPRLLHFLKKVPANADFFVMNGDMSSILRNEADIFSGYMNTFSEHTKGNLPLIYARGNHETRGAFARNLKKYFPNSTPEMYYAFRAGPVFFTVLDCGEDKPDNDIEYFGITDYDSYRAQQAEWFKKLIQTPEFKSAKVRIVFLHIPPAFDTKKIEPWHGELDLNGKLATLLNDAKVDLVISGHYHPKTPVLFKGGTSGVAAPVLVNSNKTMVNVFATEREISLDFIPEDGAPTPKRMVFGVSDKK